MDKIYKSTYFIKTISSIYFYKTRKRYPLGSTATVVCLIAAANSPVLGGHA